MRFFHGLEKLTLEQKMDISALANAFTESIPEDTFSVAELQGFLLLFKTDPNDAVKKIKPWVVKEVEERKAEEERKRKREEEKANRMLAQLRQDYSDEFMSSMLDVPPPNNEQRPRASRHRRRRRQTTASQESSSPAERGEGLNGQRIGNADSENPAEMLSADYGRDGALVEDKARPINGFDGVEGST